MIVNILKAEEVDVAFLGVDAGVRYWDDASIDGQQDDADNPSMPFIEEDRWRIVIDVDMGRIIGWPQGVEASVHYKVCDDGIYELRSREGRIIRRLERIYVPAALCPVEQGYGDYIIMDINADGHIEGWDRDKVRDMI